MRRLNQSERTETPNYVHPTRLIAPGRRTIAIPAAQAAYRPTAPTQVNQASYQPVNIEDPRTAAVSPPSFDDKPPDYDSLFPDRV